MLKAAAIPAEVCGAGATEPGKAEPGVRLVPAALASTDERRLALMLAVLERGAESSSFSAT